MFEPVPDEHQDERHGYVPPTSPRVSGVEGDKALKVPKEMLGQSGSFIKSEKLKKGTVEISLAEGAGYIHFSKYARNSSFLRGLVM